MVIVVVVVVVVVHANQHHLTFHTALLDHIGLIGCFIATPTPEEDYRGDGKQGEEEEHYSHGFLL